MPSGIYIRTKHWKHSEKSKKKMSLVRKGIKKSEIMKQKIRQGMLGKNTWMKGKKHSEETKIKMSKLRGGNRPYFKKNDYDEYKNYISWRKNKRNRVIKRLKIKSKSHTFSEWELLKKQYNFTCPCCKKSEPEIKLTEDHIIPLSKGGSDLIENVQPLCLRCNLKKHIKIIKY